MSTLQVSNVHLESTGNNRIEYVGSNTVVMYEAGNEVWRANTSGFFFANTAQVKSGLGTPSIESMAIHNLTINGGMEISQENGNTAGNTNGYYPADQFLLSFTGGHDANTYQSTITPSNSYNSSVCVEVKVSNATPNTTSYIDAPATKLEGTFTRKLGWGYTDASKLTIGLWSRCSTDLTYPFVIGNGDSSRNYLKEISLTGNTWTWTCFTIDGCTDGTWNTNTSAGVIMYPALSTGSAYANSTTDSWLTGAYFGTTTQDNFGGLGAGNTFHTTGWVAIPGEHTIAAEDAHKFLLPYDYELKRCQRYYCKSHAIDKLPGIQSNAGFGIISGTLNAGDRYDIQHEFPIEMRSSPSITYYPGSSDVAATSGNVRIYNGATLRSIIINPQLNQKGIRGYFDTNNSDSAIIFHYVANARL